MFVSDASQWSIDDHIFVFFNTREDYSDLPNFSNLENGDVKIQSISHVSDNLWKIELSNPLQTHISKDTPVRLHKLGGSFLTLSSFVLHPEEEVDFEGSLSKFSNSIGYNVRDGWPIGSKYANIVLLSYSEEEDFVEFSNLKISSSPKSETDTQQ